MALERTIWLPVRCCCTPQKVFGFLQLPEAAARADAVEITDERGQVHRVTIRRFADYRRASLRYTPDLRPQEFDDISAKTEAAVYSDDRPREFWRSLPGYMEAAEWR